MKRAHVRAFSMIELLIVLVILSVLAAQLLPSFRQHVIRSRRAEAQAALLQLMQQEERFYTQTNTYIAFSSATMDPEARQFKWWSSNGAATSAYEIEGKACDGELITECVQLIATPGTALVDASFRDDDCRQLKLTSSGLRLATGPAVRCWP
ncbi:type IV pilus assembly protein PilE [Janthinobacterium sp. HH01]|uniref:type IV pilin protein n=1 Tax=Janthinobacterium sp. HH01 TaxID=1198452 RepID=UPI0002AE7DF6|nr:type IV pilin protein [Janthinobacterium sp. HH01]ELX13473.1 type IV pilus assembly protein PilE [Janthinobacterium sp. HH01]